MSTSEILHFTTEPTIKDYLIVARKAARGFEFERVAKQLTTKGTGRNDR